MRYFLDICRTGLTAVLLHRLRSLVSVAAVVAVLLPYLVGLALAKGIEAEAEASAQFGADLYVSGRHFGRPAPVPLTAVPTIGRIEGVTAVVPRIVGPWFSARIASLPSSSACRRNGFLPGLPPSRASCRGKAARTSWSSVRPWPGG